MPPPLRALLLTALLSLGFADLGQAEASAPDPLAQISHIPESNPYRAALAAWLSLPASDRTTINDWVAHGSDYDISPAPVLTAEQQTFVRQLAHTLAQTATAPATASADWPLAYDPKDPDNPIPAFIPSIGSSRELARIATKVAGECPPSEAIALYAATAKLGRETRQGETLIQQLVGVAIEGIAQGGAARRIGEFSPAELEALSTAWKNLPPAVDPERAITTERNLFFRHFIDKELVPGTQAYFAAGEPALDHLTDDTNTTADATISRLRLSALVDFGDGEKQITLENSATGEFFTVTLKRPAEGVELLDFDIPGHRATIRVHGREAVINLRTKEIVARSDALKRFQRFLKNFRFEGEAEGDVGAIPVDITRKAWLARIKTHPGGPESYFAEALVDYDEGVARQLDDARRAEYPESSAESTAPGGALDPVLSVFTPSFGTFARALHASDTSTTMFEAAIRHRLGQPDRAPADPWSATHASDEAPAAPFTFTPTPDGGFTLRSRYERNRDEPVTYKFAAPDAGIIRRPPQAKISPAPVSPPPAP